MNSNDIKNLSKLTEALRGRETHSENHNEVITVTVTHSGKIIVSNESPVKWVNKFSETPGLSNIKNDEDLSNKIKITIDNFLNTADSDEFDDQLDSIFNELFTKLNKLDWRNNSIIYVTYWSIKNNMTYSVTFSGVQLRSVLNQK